MGATCSATCTPRRAYEEVARAYEEMATPFNREVQQYQDESTAWWNALGRAKEKHEAVAAAKRVKQAMLHAVDGVRDELTGKCSLLRSKMNCIDPEHELNAVHFVESSLLQCMSDEELLAFFHPQQMVLFFCTLASHANPGEP